ncbi:thiolase family protein [Sphaerisporangium sp. NPDC051017]|uniref:thiolase family protein n=1 Tax=Sphaerisporangium sp. NPDC051017 TaxID=3154636 RepID=UPI00341ED637
MTKALIVSAVRTAIGTSFKGALAGTSPERLATHVLTEAVRRSGIAPNDIDDVILAESLQGGGDIARYAAVQAGMISVPGQAVNRHCAGSLTSFGNSAATIMAGMADAVVAGGVQSSSLAPTLTWRLPGKPDEVREGMAPTFPYAEDADDDVTLTVGWNIAQKFGLSRERMDAWAARSHTRAWSAIDEGVFADEIVPIEVTTPDGRLIEFAVDEHPRRDSSVERLAQLKPLHPEIDGFSITAGNASGINDAAAALVLAGEDFVRDKGLTALASVRACAAVGVAPKLTGTGAIEAISKVLGRAGLSVGDVGLWEINEAFASVPVAACQELGIDESIVNQFGSGCSLGHPVAASGARMLTTLVHQLRRTGGGIGVAAMCAGGGQGGAVVVEVDRPE